MALEYLYNTNYSILTHQTFLRDGGFEAHVDSFLFVSAMFSLFLFPFFLPLDFLGFLVPFSNILFTSDIFILLMFLSRSEY